MICESTVCWNTFKPIYVSCTKLVYYGLPLRISICLLLQKFLFQKEKSILWLLFSTLPWHILRIRKQDPNVSDKSWIIFSLDTFSDLVLCLDKIYFQNQATEWDILLINYNAGYGVKGLCTCTEIITNSLALCCGCDLRFLI